MVSEIRTAQHRVWLFGETEPLWRHIEAALDAARQTVWLSTYIYRSDAMGIWFGELLARAAARGLDVRLLYDPQGSRGAAPGFFDELRSRGIRVRAYRPWRLAAQVWKYWPRDHGRILVIDEAAFTGGMNWGSEWLPASRGGGDWHDVAIGVEGPCVADFREAFRLRWSEATSTARVADYVTAWPATDLEFIADSPESAPIVLQRFCERIARAERRVWIENSYCIPPRRLLAALAAAAARGVDVKIITPAKTDLPIVQTITRGEYAEWLRHGIDLYEYEPSMMHSKFALIDDDWATVGTFNAMTTGLWCANETNVIVHGPEFASKLQDIFASDVGKSVRVTQAVLARRSTAQAIWQRCAAAIYRGIERLGARVSPLQFRQRAPLPPALSGRGPA